MTDAQKAQQAILLLRQTKKTYQEWMRFPYAKGERAKTPWAKAIRLLDEIAGHIPPSPPPPPAPTPGAPFGTAKDAGPFAGRGIMLGDNPDVWAQALQLARGGYLEVVAATPKSAAEINLMFYSTGIHFVEWFPPEQDPIALIGLDGLCAQAENQNEWTQAMGRLDGKAPQAIVLNSWQYGKFPASTVALVEAYYNEGQGLDFGIYKNYTSAGASAVLPVCGGYSAGGRSDVDSAHIYSSLSTWIGGPFPGFWMYAGESYITPESVEVLKAWKP